MKKKKSHTKFEEAVAFVNSFTEPIPADVLLKTPLINAFKANALFQAKNMNKKQAMKSYVELVAKELK